MAADAFARLGQIGTPCYVFDGEAFRARAEMVQKAFGERTKLCFSIKANPFLLSCLPDVFDKIEVCSPGELTICEKTGADMRRVIFSGVNKTAEDVRRAMDDGVGVFTAESRLHVELVSAAALERGRVAPLLLRLSAGSQFGMDAREVRDLIAGREDYPGVEIVGIHYFSGTQKKKASVIEKELGRVTAFMDGVERELGFRLRKLEYGTGLAVEYFSQDAEGIERERLESVAEAIRRVSERYELTVEMGRFFAAPCGYYAARVMDMKTTEGIHYAILDGGIHQIRYDGQIQGMQTPQIAHLPSDGRAREGDEQPYTLCGSLCTTADVLARNVMLADLRVGDILVFKRAGAYSCMEGMAVFLSRDMPAAALLSKDGELKVLREKLDTDVFNTPRI